ncbi:MAG TPA: YihY/virulence factor BrkB family protein, partial [Flavobacteriaceae bacterium]|nr:YihY/virulence factor BrkB family protein [Flavobacteriaceae bacterium]
AQTADFIDPIIVDIVANPRGSLLSFTLLLAIFLTTNGVNAIFSGFEYSFHVRIKRSIFQQYVVAFGVSLFLTVVLFISIIAIIFGQYLIMTLKEQGLHLNDVIWISIIRYLLFMILIYIVIATLYYFGTKEGKKSKFFSVGAGMTTIFFMTTTYLFTLYINNFSNYNELYGSIGAMLILMLYIWINSNLLLLGFELNATIYRLKTRNN